MKPVIVVECDNDELLLRILGVQRGRIQHEGNRDEVVKYVLNKPAEGYLGLIDEDPGTQHGAQRLHFKNGPARQGVLLATNGKRTLVVLRPFLEHWLLDAVHACGSRMSALDKGLSDEPRELHRQFSPRGDNRMKKVVDHLEKKKSKHLAELRRALRLD